MFQDPVHDRTQDILELILHAEDACDILNLYSGPPAHEARKSVLTLAHGIKNVHERHERRALMAGTSRIAFHSPTPKQILQGILVPEESMSSLYYTPHNEILVHIPTPKQMALNDIHEIPDEIDVTPITLNQHSQSPISTYSPTYISCSSS